jgi:hypothetical protein
MFEVAPPPTVALRACPEYDFFASTGLSTSGYRTRLQRAPVSVILLSKLCGKRSTFLLSCLPIISFIRFRSPASVGQRQATWERAVMGRTILIVGYNLIAMTLAGAQAAAQHYPPGYGAPPGYRSPPPCQAVTAGPLRGAARGAARGAMLGGVFGGNAGRGAAIGATMGGVGGAARRGAARSSGNCY